MADADKMVYEPRHLDSEDVESSEKESTKTADEKPSTKTPGKSASPKKEN